jgi:hypothetical protein
MTGRLHHKFKAQKTECDGIKFSSKLEQRWYRHIKEMKESGEVLFFLRQVPFHLPGEVIYRADFMLFFADGHAEIWEAKGFDTPEWLIKKKLVEAIYPIEIKIVK